VTLTRVLIAAAGTCLTAAAISAADKDNRVYEVRIYTAAPGKLDALNARFRDHTLKLFEKHGMTNVAYWVPIDNKENQLIYLLAHASKEAREKSFREFGADPDWNAARRASEEKAGGSLTVQGGVKSILLTPTDYSPGMTAGGTSSGGRVIEMRTYTATPGKLDDLNARFRNHTLKLFEKHGMTNLGYFTPVKAQRGVSDDTLIYFLAHKSVDAANKSFESFRADPDWVAARTASEQKAGGSLTVQGGVKSVFMKPTDYSPMK
jgi:NIPSNAP